MVGANQLRMMTVQEALAPVRLTQLAHSLCYVRPWLEDFLSTRHIRALVTVLACMEYTIVAGSRVFMNILIVESTGFQPQYYPERTHTH